MAKLCRCAEVGVRKQNAERGDKKKNNKSVHLLNISSEVWRRQDFAARIDCPGYEKPSRIQTFGSTSIISVPASPFICCSKQNALKSG